MGDPPGSAGPAASAARAGRGSTELIRRGSRRVFRASAGPPAPSSSRSRGPSPRTPRWMPTSGRSSSCPPAPASSSPATPGGRPSATWPTITTPTAASAFRTTAASSVSPRTCSTTDPRQESPHDHRRRIALSETPVHEEPGHLAVAYLGDGGYPEDMTEETLPLTPAAATRLLTELSSHLLQEPRAAA